MMEDNDRTLACDQALAFGPVPSRRLGLSLGVNVVPKKICSYNCIYCQLGRTTKLTVDRDEYIETKDILSAVDSKLAAANHTDYVTMIGNGEPTLASNLSQILDGVSGRWNGKFALLTNGSLLWREDVSKDASRFDAILPTVSAGDKDTFKKLHRPHPSIRFDKVVEGLKSFCDEHREKTWVEIMLVQGVNDTQESLRRIGKLVGELNPAEVHVTAPIRPPSVEGVLVPTRASIDKALAEIPGAVDFTHPEGVEMPSPATNPIRHLVEITGTHPLRHDQAMALLSNTGMDHAEAEETLLELTGRSVLVELTRDGGKFYVRGPCAL